MDTFYIITNYSKDVNLRITSRIKTYIESKGKTCVLCKKDKRNRLLKNSIPDNADCAIILGGDGTLIQAAREVGPLGIPLIGVNLGTLGYLAEVEVQHVEEAIDKLIDGKAIVEERMMLNGVINQERENNALNDIVIIRLGSLRVIHFDIYVNGELLNKYEADGVIISTPTGSTGYNLSARGPIVEPTASMIVITPICSHALNTSSIVLSADDEIIVEIARGRGGRKEEAGISFDGTRMIQVKTGDRITIRKAKEKIKLLKLSKVSFLETLRKKMKGS